MSWRSVLFTPGDRPERVAKAWREGMADVVVADLEDAVAPDRKQEAREAVADLLRADEPAACRRAVRINSGHRIAGKDLAALAGSGLDLILVPKAEDRVQVKRMAAALPPGVGIMPILETARGVLNAQGIAACHRVEAVAFGAEDLAADAGMRRSRGNDEVAVPRSLVALAAAASQVRAIDMITADYQDDERLAREATRARSLGYAGKMCIHPRQVPIVHDAFAPSPEEQAWARKVVAAADAAGAGMGGVVVVDGRMIDVPLVRQARRIVEESRDDGR